MITVQDWAKIRYLHGSEGLSIRAIAARLGLSRDTVARAVASSSPPRYSRVSGPSAFDPFEPQVRQLLGEFPTMPASVISERVGWPGSPSWFRKKVARLRAEYAPKDPADRLSYRPGDQAQCDLWFPPVLVPLGCGQAGSPPVLVMVASFSRFITAAMIPTRQTPDLLAGMWSILAEQMGAVPRRLVWDNEAGIGRGGTLAAGVAGFTGTLANRIVQLKPYDPESKGIVERANGFLETSFLPGRTFTSPADFNTQLAEWMPKANGRRVRSTNARPGDLVALDRAAMVPLSPVAPAVGFTTQVRLPRDYYLRVLGNDYSIDPSVIGRMIDVHADLDTVTGHCDGTLVASHPRSWARRQTITDPAHVQTAARIRGDYDRTRTGAAAVDSGDGALVRDLTDYDTRFGVDFITDASLDAREVAF
ncbi:IS21 family transposase [Actinopolymorpha sp. B9G3]|uniref:IS21 family transposase n=1 Tax=Actinopolymorpha sp. B9G3 TaxID=3158970 RepID=UPI0032D96DC1